MSGDDDLWHVPQPVDADARGGIERVTVEAADGTTVTYTGRRESEDRYENSTVHLTGIAFEEREVSEP